MFISEININSYLSGDKSDWTFPLEIHGAYNRVEVNGYRYLAHYKKTTHWNLGKPYILYITFHPYNELDDDLREVTETKSAWNKYPNYLNGFKGGHQFRKYDAVVF